jgi:membrane protease YdiL (CAAX protease family)
VTPDGGKPTESVAGEGAWGRGATLGLAILALLAGQMAALTALTWWYGAGIAHLPDFSGDGVAVTLIILISTPVQTILLWLLAHQAGGDAARYLGYVRPRGSDIAIGVAAVIAFIVIGDAVTWAFGRNVVTGFQDNIYRTAAEAGWLPWLWLVVVVVTPFGEETLFRGFLFRGWHRTPGDAWAVILVTAALFAIVHVQYDLFVIAQVFVSGVMLGWFRWVSGSTLLTMLLHGLINFEGMVETFIALHR